MTITHRPQLSDFFTYAMCTCINTSHQPEILFQNVQLLYDIVTHKGTYVEGTVFPEVSLNLSTLLMTFFSDGPHGYFTDFEINIRIEQDL